MKQRTFRQELAARAMEALLVSRTNSLLHTYAKDTAAKAVECADALLAELKRTKKVAPYVPAGRVDSGRVPDLKPCVHGANFAQCPDPRCYHGTHYNPHHEGHIVPKPPKVTYANNDFPGAPSPADHT